MTTRTASLIGAVVIAVALIAADFGATALGFSHAQQQEWGLADTVGLLFVGWFLYRGSNSSK